MDNIFSNLRSYLPDGCNISDIDINKLLVIILLLTDKLQVEAIHVYKNNFVISLGTFIQD